MMLRGGQAAGFESSVERDLLLTLDFDPRVVLIQEQPFTLRYQHEGKLRRYTPDVLAIYLEDGVERTVVYEAKTQENLEKEWQQLRPRFKAAVSYCRKRGWRFEIVTDRVLRSAYLENIRFLRGYREDPVDEGQAKRLRQVLCILGPTTPHQLIAAAWQSRDNQAMAIAQMWRMVVHGEIQADLTKRLTMSSEIWRA